MQPYLKALKNPPFKFFYFRGIRVGLPTSKLSLTKS